MINKYNASCVALGNFDGIHIGHDILIRRMVEISQEENLRSIIITFKFVKSDLKKSKYNMKYINNLDTRLNILNSYGVYDVVQIELDETISKYSPEEFIKVILKEKFNAKNIVVGYNFTFGYKAMGNINTLKEFEQKYDYKVEEIQPVKFNGVVVSSTLIRNLIKEGKIQEVNSLLIKNYAISSKDIFYNYNKNFAFVNNKSSIVIPAEGVYKVKIGDFITNVTIVPNDEGSFFKFENNIKPSEINDDIIFI
ncbi:MAG: cytidyltransferase-related domain protein [Bacillota bacterium]|jgi:riboflavin kinase/FMN adenylyltransferase|nr:cytidyltransferase-related domain protein [Bacillota bacterium]